MVAQPKSKRVQLVRLALVALVLSAAATAVALNLNPLEWFGGDKQKPASTAQAPAPLPAPAQAVAPPAEPVAALPAGSAPNYRAIARQAGPAVVGVTVAGTHKGEGASLPPGMEDDPFFQFFRGLPGLQGRLPRGDVPFRGQGSGFIISSDGLILTNAHVVRDAKEVTVKLGDRREFSAKVLGSDMVTDVAVLRIEARNLPVVRLGDAQQLQVGDPVLAIGSPFGFEQTATQGIVSAKGRSLPGDGAVPFVQTDAAVNPGNSGGPLFDGSGAVVGINAQIYSQSGGYQGLAFAIPINVALKVKDQIVATGKAQHARLGVTVQDLNQTLADSFGLGRPDGALVVTVVPDGAAAAAGLRAGDVVTDVDGEPILRSGDLSSRIGMAVPGESVRLKIWRDRSAREVTARLGRAEDGSSVKALARGAEPQPGQIGLQVRPLTRDEQARARLEGGLLVEGVAGPAARAGVRPGDVVVSVNGVPVVSVEQLRAIMEKRPRNVALLIDRGGERIFVPVGLG
jgi:serine protease Do